MNWRARRKARYFAKCSCGRTYNRKQWYSLKNLGRMHLPADATGPESNIEMRNCVCGSTMAVEFGPNVSRDPKKKPMKWVDFIRKVKGDPKFRKKNGGLDLRKLATAYRAYKKREGKPSLILRTKHPDMNGLHIKYSRVNDAYFVMWHDAVLKIAHTRGEAETFVRKLTKQAKVSNDPRLRRFYVTVRYLYGGKAFQTVVHQYAESAVDAKDKVTRRLDRNVKILAITATEIAKKRR